MIYAQWLWKEVLFEERSVQETKVKQKLILFKQSKTCKEKEGRI